MARWRDDGWLGLAQRVWGSSARSQGSVANMKHSTGASVMNKFNNNLPLGPSAPIGEILLAETAVRIELPPSLHRLAVDRYEALREYIERAGSPLAGRVRIFY